MKKHYLTSISTLFILSFLTLYTTEGQTGLPPELWKNTGDYTFMYYPEPLQKTTEFHIQTSRHFLAFDYKTLELRDLRMITDPLPEAEAVRRNLDFLPLQAEVNLLDIRFKKGETEYRLSRGSQIPKENQLIESGKFFQRRLLTNLGFDAGGPEAETTLEISSWPDRLAFVLVMKPTAYSATDTLIVDFTIPENLRNTMVPENNNLLAVDENGNGFLFHTTGQNCRVMAGNNTFQINQGIGQDQNFKAELIIIPVKNYQGGPLESLLINERGNINIQAAQTAPLNAALTSEHDPVHGWYDIFLRNDGIGNDRIERVKVELTNPDSEERTIRLNFHKRVATGVYGITGISAIIRDKDMNPIGIPVQLSKNWHRGDNALFEGPWFRGFTMMSIPAETNVEFEFTLVNAKWGKLPAASHAQLSLVGWNGGWGDNQLWDQSAIGAWGESACYEPDGGQVQTMITDIRPLMIQSLDPALKPKKWNWTPNVGGADFFRFYDQSGVKQHITRIKAQYKRYCPNLTEVTYAGTTSGNEADYELTTSIYRSDDYVRAVFKIKLTVNEPIDFSRLAVIQVGSETYSYTGERKFAFGDESGMIEEWGTQWGGSSYRKTGLNTDGNLPWVSMHEAVNRTPSEWGSWANRGLIVRKWDAKIAGVPAKPYFSEYGAVARGTATSLVEINPGPGTNQLLPGDYIEAEIVQVIIPQQALSYYGPNQNFFKELVDNENTWKPVYREAVGNNLALSVKKGTLLHTFPPVVEVNSNNEAEIEVEGGLGFVPFTFTGLTSYKDFSVKIWKEGKEISFTDQEAHGKDYWQTDYDPIKKTWEVTYSVPLDSVYNFIEEQSSIVLYNDFDKDQPIPWSNPSSLSFMDKVDNPSPSDINLSPKTGRVVRGSGVHASLRFQLPEHLDLSENNLFKVQLYYEGSEPLPPVCNIRLILRNNGLGTTQYALTQNISGANRWNEYIFNCSGAVGRDTYNQVWLFFSSPDNEGISSGQTIYVDNLRGPPLIINPELVDIRTSSSGDSIIIDFSRSNHKLDEIINPVFALYHKASGSLIKTGGLTNDSLRIFLTVTESIKPTGRDSLVLSFISGKIEDDAGRYLPYFTEKRVQNTIPINAFFAKFIVSDEKTQNKLSNVLIATDTVSALTNIPGEAVFALAPGSHDFMISKSGYLTIDTSLNILSDINIFIHLKPSKAWIKFRVLDGLSPLYNAFVALNGDSKQTNTLGIAAFEGLDIYNTYEYSVGLAGFETQNGSVILKNDTTVFITLMVSTGISDHNFASSISPNPFTGKLSLELREPAVKINILNIYGTVIKEFTRLETGLNILPLDDLPAGVFVMVIQYDGRHEYLKIIKQ